MSSHCLICGSLIVSGNICRECKWEITRIRLKEDAELSIWLDSKMNRIKPEIDRKEIKIFQ